MPITYRTNDSWRIWGALAAAIFLHLAALAAGRTCVRATTLDLSMNIPEVAGTDPKMEEQALPPQVEA